MKIDMKTIITILLTITLAVPAFAQTSAGDKPPVKEKWIRVKIEASVEKINREKREITLKDPRGNLVALTATEAVKRFDEINVETGELGGFSLEKEGYITYEDILSGKFRGDYWVVLDMYLLVKYRFDE